MAQIVRDSSRRLRRVEGALRAAQQQNAALAEICQHPVGSRFLKVYGELLAASDPLRGRSIEAGGSSHPFDRPMPTQFAQEFRQALRRVDRALARMCDWMVDLLNASDPRPGGPVCVACGGPVDRSGRPPSRRAMACVFLEKNLQGPPVREETVRWAAQSLGIGRDTLRRAADELGVRRFVEDNVWWWELTAAVGGEER